MSRTPRALIAAAGVTLLLALAAPTPAAAAEPPSTFALLQASSIPVGVDESTTGKTARLDVMACCTTSPGTVLPDTLAVIVDAAPASFLTVSVSGASCTASGTKTTCASVPVTPVVDLVRGRLRVTMKVVKGTPVGTSGSLKVTVSGAGATAYTENFPISVSASNADLVADDFSVGETQPGGVAAFRPTIVNSGDQPAKIVALYLFAGGFTGLETRFSNCRYQDMDASATVGYCEFPINLAAGAGVRVSADTPVTVNVQRNVMHRLLTGGQYFVEVLDSPIGGDMGKPGDGPALKLEPFTPNPASADFDNDSHDNSGELTIQSGPNPSDMAVAEAAVAGAAGATLPLKINLKNNGPAYVFGALDGEGLSPDAPNQPAITVTLPEGVTVMSLPHIPNTEYSPLCAPIIDGKADWEKVRQIVGRSYRCTQATDIDAGVTLTYEFTVKYAGAPANGTVVASGGFDDPDTSNNTAAITFPGGGNGGGLPVTGVSVGLLSTVGGLIIAAGAALYLTVWRRRLRLTVE